LACVGKIRQRIEQVHRSTLDFLRGICTYIFTFFVHNGMFCFCYLFIYIP
jgi:hypothetical protein